MENESAAQCLLFGEHTLQNGRRYKLTRTGEAYKAGEYPSGGIHIAVWLDSQQWGYVDHAPDEECAKNFLVHAARLPKRATHLASPKQVQPDLDKP